MKTVRTMPGPPHAAAVYKHKRGPFPAGPHRQRPPSLRPRTSLTCWEFGRWLPACPDPERSSLNPRDTSRAPGLSQPWYPGREREALPWLSKRKSEAELGGEASPALLKRPRGLRGGEGASGAAPGAPGHAAWSGYPPCRHVLLSVTAGDGRGAEESGGKSEVTVQRKNRRD